ncbi:hypothetical protein [Actinotalea sp. K2]|uniref:hypothetical protein n=1 Tax=Actinotalea sp. K2 TaxID=2939438 RepID=UPI002016FC80|nr:hypothetical protein [Actinotalea sp. K2]MCL3859931.1 hypothetical protein [Actinotalea sp. K2]
MKKPLLIGLGSVGVVVVGLVAFAACTPSDPEPTPGPTSSASPDATQEPEADGWTRAEIAAALFDGDIGTSEVLGSVDGQVTGPSSAYPATIEVTDVLAGQESTLVRFTLRNVDDSDPLVPLEAFNAATPLTRDTRDVALVVSAEDQRLQPFLAVTDGDRTTSFCTCSTAPVQMSQRGQLLSATFPPLDAGTEQVSLELPGFPLVEDLPVRRD